MTAPQLVPNRPALIEFVTKHRPDLHTPDIEGALIALEQAGWTWNRIVMATAAMVCHLEEPRDLREAARNPLRKITR
ncbi:hypothetical protein ACIBI3_02270 [Actinomadura luteofluorescens]|uniref:hypothetical protein n=1 Tax=Actinomadura luteofluorescens TaxID=46163 RepID=UPI00348E5FA0